MELLENNFEVVMKWLLVLLVFSGCKGGSKSGKVLEGNVSQGEPILYPAINGIFIIPDSLISQVRAEPLILM